MVRPDTGRREEITVLCGCKVEEEEEEHLQGAMEGTELGGGMLSPHTHK